jgi:16S rRNA G527 N7-methylase RsmG
MAWAGVGSSPTIEASLSELSAWILNEAMPSGGVGPNERERIDDRHIADSITFAWGWAHRESPMTILDLGAGAGLPALPLAIIHPASQVIAVDRSGKRCQIMKRAARVLGLENLVAVCADITGFHQRADAVVSRAAMPPDALRPHLQRLTLAEGTAIVGGSHVERPEVAGFRTVEIPPEVLDRSAWLLMMTQP